MRHVIVRTLRPRADEQRVIAVERGELVARPRGVLTMTSPRGVRRAKPSDGAVSRDGGVSRFESTQRGGRFASRDGASRFRAVARDRAASSSAKENAPPKVPKRWDREEEEKKRRAGGVSSARAPSRAETTDRNMSAPLTHDP